MFNFVVAVTAVILEPKKIKSVTVSIVPPSILFLAFYHKGDVICISKAIDIFPGNLDASCASSSLAFHMMYSAYKLNKQGDNIQP